MLTQLGNKVPIPTSPHDAELETFDNPNPEYNYVVRFSSNELTSNCPATHQPDFGHLVLDYIPNRLMIESKSLKLFLASFRYHNAFHEACTMLIAKRLIEAMEPRWLRIAVFWNARGGIPIDVFYQTDAPPKGVAIPALVMPRRTG